MSRAQFDRKINGDDLGRYDFGNGLGIADWYNADVNYDGKVNIDDFGIMDFNMSAQGDPL